MQRRLLNLLTTVSLVLCVAVVVLWARSYRSPSVVEFDRRGTRWAAASERGAFRLDNRPQRRLEAEAASRERASLMAECVRLDQESVSLKRRLSKAADADRPGIEVEVGRVRAASAVNRRDRAALMAKPASTTPPAAYGAPHWAVAVAAGLLPAHSLARAARRAGRKRSRLSAGLCPACGYDLRATPGRCPECGDAPFETPA